MKGSFTLILVFLTLAAACGKTAENNPLPDGPRTSTEFQSQATAFAAASDTGFIDVDAGAWYADAVEYCVARGLMSGTGGAEFSPNTPISRVMLAAVLYRLAGSPEITGVRGFADVEQGAWYADAVLWAAQNEMISGYGSGLFGTYDPVTREQIAAILWRYSGRPAASDSAPLFLDAADISSYAAEAVIWARSRGLITGKPGNLFDPKGTATRAEAAMILWNYLSAEQPEPAPEQPAGNGTTNIGITVGGSVFSAVLCDNDAARAFGELLPLTIPLNELNGNEKYYYLPDRLPADPERTGSIRTGDLMLYGDNCLVLFYQSFSTSYSYTRLGYIEDVSGLAAALGSGSAEVMFTAGG